MSNHITKILKRSGDIADFDQSKITTAIWKAMQAVEEGSEELANHLSNKVIEKLEKKFHFI